MLTKEPGPERAALQFQETTLSSFRFLETMGFRPIQEEVTLLRYESSEMFMNVYRGRASYELNVEIGRLDEPNDKLYLGDIVASAGTEKAEGFGQHTVFQVSSREGVQEFVPKLAALVKKYAIPLLRGDREAFASAKRLQSSRGKELLKEINLKGIRSKAEAAWHAKDYAQVIELYDPVREDLTEVEAKKLTYAEQQVLTAEGVSSRSSRRKR